ncbi:MAG: site-specific integrase, partial [Gammaproteobacteria bacterium]|nr:site-specific integrase [Gammaproteobacteria bacterium]
LDDRHADNSVQTFSSLGRLYLERHARKHKSPRSIREDERIIARELVPKWGSRRITDIRRRDVIGLLDEIADRPAPIMANRVRALVSKLFNFAISRDLLEANPCAQVPRPGREEPRQRVLTDNELEALWGAFGKLGPIMGPMFKLRLLTLQRGAEITSMRWEDIDHEDGWWTIPPERAKNRLAHRVPLSPQALTILRELVGYQHENGWAFPSPTRPAQHVANIGKAVMRVKVISGIADYRPHDMRRTGASRLTGLGIPRLTVGKILNHVENSVTAVYDRHSYDTEKRHALEAWGAYVERLVEYGEHTENVIPLPASEGTQR